MASYGQVSKGSSGNDVLELQKILNQNGYNLTEDGIFGDNTLAAVKDYQANNGLTVDGIVGKNTWGALTSSNKSSGSTTGTSTGFTYDDYVESDTVKQANAALQAQIAAKPGEYQSQWQDKINNIIDQILNREEFSYDVNSDALYQQYKEQYTSLGKLAMQDTMGQAAAMTGGYGNSYASSVGNQAYQAYLSQLNEVVPELYGMALDKYNAEGQEMYNQYGLLADQENQDYGRYMDEYNQWASERDHLQNVYDNERAFDYSKYAGDRNLEYSEYRNAIADEQWQKEYDESVRQYDEQMAITKEQWELQKQQYNGSSKSYSGTTSSGTKYNNGGLTNDQVKELQAALGVDTDGYYGPASKEAAGGLSAEKAYAKYVGGSSTDNDEEKSSYSLGELSKKASTFESNEELAEWAYRLADAGSISEEMADALIATYMDSNEKYVDNSDGSKTLSYSEMAKSTKGWEVVSDGGANWTGLDKDAKVRTPNGEVITLENLKTKLVNEGMKDKDAKNLLKELQQNLGISSNWMFGL